MVAARETRPYGRACSCQQHLFEKKDCVDREARRHKKQATVYDPGSCRRAPSARACRVGPACSFLERALTSRSSTGELRRHKPLRREQVPVALNPGMPRARYKEGTISYIRQGPKEKRRRHVPLSAEKAPLLLFRHTPWQQPAQGMPELRRHGPL